MPVVAETYDGMVNDICGRHITERHALEALQGAALAVRWEEGTSAAVPATRRLMSSRAEPARARADAPSASALTPWVCWCNPTSALGAISRYSACRWGNTLRKAPLSLQEGGALSTAPIVVVIATDAPLNPTQLHRLAKRGAIGIGRTGTRGGHYSGDLILAFSVANEIYLPAIGEPQPHSFRTEWLNDSLLDDLYGPTVEAIEESI